MSYTFIDSPKSYIIKGIDEKYLYIDRLSGIFSEKKDDTLPTTGSNEFSIDGLIGCVKLLAGEYIIVATKSTKIITIVGHTILQLKNISILPVFTKPAKKILSLSEYRDEKKYISLIESALSLEGYYFVPSTDTYDLTSRFQRQASQSKSLEKRKNIWVRQDTRFCWNRNMALTLVEKGASKWTIALISGLIERTHGRVLDKRDLEEAVDFELILISRRHVENPGMRFLQRGVDPNGYAANFVETEQIIIIDKNKEISKISSFVQTRGSIPVEWDQYPSLKWCPRVNIHNWSHTSESFHKHIKTQTNEYGKQVVIDLVDQKGDQFILSALYQHNCNSFSIKDKIQYIGFDFHKQCRGMKYERINSLVNTLHSAFINMSVFSAELINDNIQNTGYNQSGVFRTNCMDCLDRTNVVQSVFSRIVMKQQFQSLGLLINDDRKTLLDCSIFGMKFDKGFKCIWANNADRLSKLYAGSPAMKTDYVRTGKRTVWGQLTDAKVGIARYYLNNFCDGTVQDSYNILLGNYIPTLDKDNDRLSYPSLLTVFISSITGGKICGSFSDGRIILLLIGIALYGVITSFNVNTNIELFSKDNTFTLRHLSDILHGHSSFFLYLFLLVYCCFLILYNPKSYVTRPLFNKSKSTFTEQKQIFLKKN